MNPKVRENAKKRRKDDFVDDGRVIADMSIDGMPGTISRRRRKPPVPFGTVREEPEPVKLTWKERISAYGGAYAAYAPVWLCDVRRAWPSDLALAQMNAS